ncbi:MAG: hypothetical protein O2887_16770 [Bacteroidetes bacterium]|nr:hypothetical protein [Bacteroidota bacterium]MDA1122115.1 hypothetical protein [Bacteroidota bacterium]
MNPLIDAILHSDDTTVRNLLKSSLVLVNKRSTSRDLPIELAKKNGQKKIEVIFVRYTDWTCCYSKDELKQLLVDFISEISEDYFAAGWLNGIEFDLWRLISTGNLPEYHSVVTLDEDLDIIEGLRLLSNITNTWAIWDDTVGDAVPIELGEWKQRI